MKSFIFITQVNKRFIGAAKKLGARAYVPKSEVAVALMKALQAAIRNDEFFVVH